MHADFWHLLRPPIPVDHEMPPVQEGALKRDNIVRAFPDDYERLLVRIMIRAAFDNERQEMAWAGVNAAYIERWASHRWAVELRKSPWWFLKIFLFTRNFVVAEVRSAVDRLTRRGLLHEQMEWDLIEEGECYGPSNRNMPVCYPLPALIDELNAALPCEQI